MTLLQRFLFISLIQITSSWALEIHIPQDQVINICVEDSGWPPFSILESRGEKNGELISGKNHEFLKYIFKKYNLKYSIHIKPWKRCLYEGIHGNIQIVLDAALNDQRRKEYITTQTIYELTPVFLYSTKKFSSLSKEMTSKQLKKLGQGCGQVGYIYDNFGFQNEELNLQAKDLQNLLSLVSKRRCAFGLARLEVYQYEKELYNNFNELNFGNILNAQNESFFWLINKNYKYAAHLKTIIDDEISRKSFIFTVKK